MFSFHMRHRSSIFLFFLTSFLGCDDQGILLEESPCGNYRVYVQRHPMPFAFPGQGSDAPATLRITNGNDEVIHKLEIDMVQLIAYNWQYSAGCTTFRQRTHDEICLPVLPPARGMEQRILTNRAIDQIEFMPNEDFNRPEKKSEILQLLRQIKNLNRPDQRGRYLLASAIRKRNIPLIKMLLQFGANIDGEPKSGSPLHNFWLSDETFMIDISVLRLLLAYSPDLQKRNEWGATVLEHLKQSIPALSRQNQKAFRVLLNL